MDETGEGASKMYASSASKDMGPRGDRGYVVQVKRGNRGEKILEDATDGEATRIGGAAANKD